jgi:hypothetical protein
MILLSWSEYIEGIDVVSAILLIVLIAVFAIVLREFKAPTIFAFPIGLFFFSFLILMNNDIDAFPIAIAFILVGALLLFVIAWHEI